MISKVKTKLKFNAPATASLWYIFSNIFARGTTFLFTPLFTRLLPPEEYGVYSLYISFMGIFTVLTTLEISGALTYRGLAKFKGEEDSFISSLLGVQLLLTASSLILYTLFRKSVNSVTSLSTPLSVLLILQIFLNSAEGIYFAQKRYFYEYRTVSAINIITGILSPFLALFLIRHGYGGTARIIAPFLVSVFAVVPIVRLILKRGGSLFQKDGWKFTFKTALPMLPHFIALSVIAQGDKIIVARLIGEGAVGSYSVSYSAGIILLLITGGISLAINPYIIKNMSAGKDKIRGALDGVTRLLSIIILLFLSVIPEVFGIIAPPEYYGAFSVVYPVGISVIFSFLATTFSTVILHYEKPMKITKNSLICATVSVILCFFLIKRLGYIGGAYATLISYFLLFALNFFTARKLADTDILSVKKSSVSFLLLFSFSVFLFLLRKIFLARFFVIFALSAMLLYEGGKCKNLLVK